MLCRFYVEQDSLFVVRGFSSQLFSPGLPQAPAAYLEIITNNHILTLFLAGLMQESRKLRPAVNKWQCNTFWFRDVQLDRLRRTAVGRQHEPADRLSYVCVSPRIHASWSLWKKGLEFRSRTMRVNGPFMIDWFIFKLRPSLLHNQSACLCLGVSGLYFPTVMQQNQTLNFLLNFLLQWLASFVLLFYY